MSEFLKLEDLIDFSDTGYEEAVVKLLQDNGIIIDDFQYVGKCDSECPNCGSGKLQRLAKKYRLHKG